MTTGPQLDLKKFKFWGPLALVLIGTGVWLSVQLVPSSERLPIIGTVPDWTLINESGQPFGSMNLKGKVYLANFVFSRCPSVCPKMLRETQEIQKRLSSKAGKVVITTFTVDPDFDTPAVLQKVARDHGANPHQWTFLTSEDKDVLFKLYSEGFKVGVSEAIPVGDLFDIAHSERIVLVDQQGKLRGYYSYTPESLLQLMTDTGHLLEE